MKRLARFFECDLADFKEKKRLMINSDGFDKKIRLELQTIHEDDDFFVKPTSKLNQTENFKIEFEEESKIKTE